jgi:hypothetical protein
MTLGYFGMSALLFMPILLVVALAHPEGSARMPTLCSHHSFWYKTSKALIFRPGHLHTDNITRFPADLSFVLGSFDTT